MPKKNEFTVRNELLNKVRQFITDKSWSDKRLPSEIFLAKKFGCARKTLRKVFEILAAQKIIYRIPKVGTFVYPAKQFNEKSPLIILVADPDFADNPINGNLHLNLIREAANYACRTGLSVISMPVADLQNTSESENFLPENSRVAFMGNGFLKYLPVLAEKNCSLAIYTGRVALSHFENFKSVYCLFHQNSSEAMANAVQQLYDDGARKIFYFGSDFAVCSQKGKDGFFQKQKELQLDYSEENFHVYSRDLPFFDRLKLLNNLYKKYQFDGLYADLHLLTNSVYPGNDFYADTGIPHKMPLILSNWCLANQKNIYENARFSYRIDRYKKLVEALIERRDGIRTEYETVTFPKIKEIFSLYPEYIL